MLKLTKHKNFPFTKLYFFKKKLRDTKCLFGSSLSKGFFVENFLLEMTKIYLYYEKFLEMTKKIFEILKGRIS